MIRKTGQLILFHFLLLLFTGCTNSKISLHSINGLLIPIDSSIVGDKQLEKEIAPFRQTLNAEMNQKIGVASSSLTKGLPESTLANFVADLILEEANIQARKKNLPHPQIAVINTRGLRAPIKQGDVLRRHIFALMPFENEMIILQLKGHQVETLCHHMASYGGDGVAGVTFGLQNNQAKDIRVNKQALDPTKTYTIVTSDYLANGGDHYTIFKHSETRADCGLKVREAIIRHIELKHEAGQSIEGITDNRIYHVN